MVAAARGVRKATLLTPGGGKVAFLTPPRAPEVACADATTQRSGFWTVVFVVAFGTNVPTPLLLVYRDELGLSPAALTGAFGVYAAGLVPALLLAGPASDRFGRRPVVIPFVVLRRSPRCCSSARDVGGGAVLCRFLQGAVSGVVFSVGTAWLGRARAPTPLAPPGSPPRRWARGWAIGPLVSGVLASGHPADRLPYLLHVALMVVGLVLLPARARDAAAGTAPRRCRAQPGRPGTGPAGVRAGGGAGGGRGVHVRVDGGDGVAAAAHPRAADAAWRSPGSSPASRC